MAIPRCEKSFRFDLFEIGGAMGDLGTLLPLTVALITLNGLNATSAFLVVGIAYLASGFVYRLPVPVQPLKAVAAIAIASGLSASVISASGLVMAAILLLLLSTGTINWVGRLFSKPLIRGIQLGIGIMLVKAGLLLVNKQEIVMGGDDESVMFQGLTIPINWIITILLGITFVLLLRNKKLPASLSVVGIGIIAGMFWGSLIGLQSLHFGLAWPRAAVPTVGDLSSALVLLVIPQIPLTLGNSVFATTDTARTYFGDRAKRVNPKSLLATMGASNMAAGLLGGMPVCHGSGGLTAHFRLGARTGGAGLMLGIFFVALAIFVDGNVLPILSLIPYPLLGILVIFVGVQHSLLARDLARRQDYLVAFTVAIAALVTNNLAIGFALGMCLIWAFPRLSKCASKWLLPRDIGGDPDTTVQVGSSSLE